MLLKNQILTALIGGLVSIGSHAGGGWVATSTQPHPVRLLIPNAMDNGEVASGQLTHIAISLAVRNKAGLDALSSNILSGQGQAISDAQFMA